MKKILRFSLLVGLIALTGCSNDKSATEGTTTKTDNNNEEVTLYVMRHGKTMLNTTDRVQGWSDAVLTPEGEKVVHSAGKGLKDVDFQSVYSSDSGRAMQTANIVIEENTKGDDLTLITNPGLREFNFGTYEGDLNHTMWQDIADDQGVSLDEFMSTMTTEGFANSVAKIDKERNKDGKNWPAEDYNTITTRLKSSLDGIVEVESGKDGSGNVLVVSHGLSIQAMVDMLFEDANVPPGGLKNASVTKIIYKDGEYSLADFNDTSFIEENETN